MTNRLRYIPLCLLALAIVTPRASQAQQYYDAARNDQVVAPAPLPQAQLDALLAPIALYPDQLLAQMLMAATYPDDVANAARFVRENPSFTGAALDQALQGQNWDPSVLSLAAYPQVLLMMYEMPDWTRQLGDAFLANQQQVMDTVQMLRSRAQAAGNLRSTPQQSVIDQGGVIDIEPAQPQYVYVPVYDPTVIYGTWSEAYVPAYWYPPAIYGYPDLAYGIAAGIFFGTPCRIDYNHWGWARPNWRGHDIAVDVRHNYFANRPQYADRWRYGRWTPSPEQRHNVANRDTGSQWARPGNAAFQPREQQYRTRDPAQTLQTQQAIARPVQQPQQGAWRAPQQSTYAGARPAPHLSETFARPLPQQPSRQNLTREPPRFSQPQQSFARSAPPPQQSFARSIPPPSRQFANPVVQRGAPEMARSEQPRAQIQANVRHGEGHRS